MESLRIDDNAIGALTDSRLVSCSVRATNASVRALFSRIGYPRTFWAGPAEPTIAGCGATVELRAPSSARFDTIANGIDRLFDDYEYEGPKFARPRLLGGFSFDDEHTRHPPWTSFPSAMFVLPSVQLVTIDDDTWLTATRLGSDIELADLRSELEDSKNKVSERMAPATEPDPDICDVTRTISRSTWRKQIAAIMERIESGTLSKAVLAQSLSVTLTDPLSSPVVLDRLTEVHPNCYRFLVEPDDHSMFFGATPERLVSRSGRSIEMEALAGSMGRGDTKEEDKGLSDELLASAKDRHEHELVVDAIRSQLEPVTDCVTMGDLSVRQLPTVQHLETSITAKLSSNKHIVELVRSLHPTPAVGGIPPTAALSTIRATERFERGWYASPIGWLDADGNGTFAIAIRSAVANGTSVNVFAGAGIVAESDPNREWEEVQLKYRPILDALEAP